MSLMKYETKITLFNSYFDENDNLSAKAILNIFQDVASIHADYIGVGYEEMLNKNLYWVLSRIKFDILEMPQINETVVVQTWPQEKGRIDFDRDFKILSETGDVYIIGTSKWCVINSETRSLQRTDNVVYNGECLPDKNYEEKFGKITLPEQELEYSFTHEVRFCDLDHNKHMNNTNYANLAVNVVQNKVFKHFEINFLTECLLGDKIEVSSTKNNSGEFVLGKNNEKDAFICFIS